MELVPVESDEAWDALLAAQPQRSLYHTSAWLSFQAEQFGFDLHRLVIRDEGADMGLFPLFLTRRAIFRVSASPRGVDYLNLGPLLPPHLMGQFLDCYEQWARSRRLDYTSVAFMREIDAAEAAKRGYKCEQHKLCLVDLTGGEDAVYNACKRGCRKEVRRAENHGVTVVEGSLSEHLDTYLQWSNQIYARSGAKSPLTGEVLPNMLAALERAGCLQTLRAELDGRVIGMYVVGHYGGTGYSLDIVADQELRHIPAGNLMTWHALRSCCRRGMHTFDFGGARISSIARFKLSFGGVITPYTNITKPHSLLARTASKLIDATLTRLRACRFRRSSRAAAGRQVSSLKPHKCDTE